jgi:hypothetical protein
MARCAYCHAETEMYFNEVPLCVACSERQDTPKRPQALESQLRARMMQELLDTSARAKSASEAFLVLMKETPSGLPHPDGAQRIQNASRELSIARTEMEKAHSRLNLYLSRGILHDDENVSIDE